MPEGDVVLRTARRLHAALAGQPLTVSDLRWPSLATVDLTGRTVTEVVATGKHLRVYVPYGDQWYGYFMRRLAERPANLVFFMRSLVSKR